VKNPGDDDVVAVLIKVDSERKPVQPGELVFAHDKAESTTIRLAVVEATLDGSQEGLSYARLLTFIPVISLGKIRIRLGPNDELLTHGCEAAGLLRLAREFPAVRRSGAPQSGVSIHRGAMRAPARPRIHQGFPKAPR
jgi:hypothetical protein